MKRSVDLLLAVPAFIVLSPLLIAVAAAIYLTMGSPVFFRQTRPGLNGKPFQLIKFCTMTNGCDADGCLLPDCERFTPLVRTAQGIEDDQHGYF